MPLTGDRLQRLARSTAGELPGVSHGRPFTDKLDVYKVAGKVFLIVTDDPHEQIITVKTEPEYARSLRRRHESITVGRYLNKKHWISLAAGQEITATLVKDLVAESYDLVAASVPAHRRPGSG
ncbi:MmcQ/YjbR family DNA-binding protein [Actinomadura sp. NAK00032]|uniref:MmcQ/YjbR family DNA-binding protein n=1 Tax=Actinomadura sp. NAK00032 TaxID=2742128 RepID=UPI001590D45F|nr:MmcQ/YjbR family DNA-binding protein [Actinomadura sp. NAK00032]QKW38006.1 MmcQ/YjbR family DNA-binding protein [Actinomadura sp. NAK00032]